MAKRSEPRRLACRLAVKVAPRAAANQIVGWSNERVRVRIAAAPEAGRANAALEAFLAESFGLKRRQVRVISGHTNANKVVELEGLGQAELDAKLPPRDSRD